jgi:hypothetical protein
MEYKQAKRRFNSWLQRNGAYEQYKHNRHIANNSRSSWGYRIRFNSPMDFISMAFDWSDTPEGDQFWGNLHLKWSRLWRDLYSHMKK